MIHHLPEEILEWKLHTKATPDKLRTFIDVWKPMAVKPFLKFLKTGGISQRMSLAEKS